MFDCVIVPYNNDQQYFYTFTHFLFVTQHLGDILHLHLKVVVMVYNRYPTSHNFSTNPKHIFVESNACQRLFSQLRFLRKFWFNLNRCFNNQIIHIDLQIITIYFPLCASDPWKLALDKHSTNFWYHALCACFKPCTLLFLVCNHN